MFNEQTNKTVSFTEAEKALRLQQERFDPGKFIYEEDGFTYIFKDGVQKVKWSEIKKLVAYKIDLYSYDEICMDIVLDNWQMTITEETPGWDVFIKKLETIFPALPDNWFGMLMQPPFATNLTVLYERDRPVIPESK